MSEKPRFRGIVLEHPDFETRGYRNAVRMVQTIEGLLRKPEIEALGDLPHEGPALVVANHPSTESTIILPWVMTELVHRPMQLVVRDTLLDPSIQEEAEVLERTGKKDDLLNAKKNMWLREKIGAFVRESGGNAIPVHRGDPSRETFRQINKSLQDGRLVGIFLQETRTPEDDLRNAMQGPAFIMRQNPEVPVYLMAMTNVGIKRNDPATWRHPHISVSPGMTLKDIGQSLRTAEVHEVIVDRMEGLLRRRLPHVKR
jgi:hypothetical protein